MINFVQSQVFVASTYTKTCVLGTPTLPGDLIVVFAGSTTTQSQYFDSTISDSAGNVWTNRIFMTEHSGGTDDYAGTVFTCISPVSVTSITVTLTSNTSPFLSEILVAEFSGVSSLDVSTSSTSTTATLDTLSLTSTVAGDLALGFCVGGVGSAVSINSGLTNIASGVFWAAHGYTLGETLGSHNFTFYSNFTHKSYVALFKPIPDITGSGSASFGRFMSNSTGRTFFPDTWDGSNGYGDNQFGVWWYGDPAIPISSTLQVSQPSGQVAVQAKQSSSGVGITSKPQGNVSVTSKESSTGLTVTPNSTSNGVS